MKVKQHIYHWLFFLLPALMLAGSTISCSNDSVIEEKEIINGKTSLVVTVRSITTNSQGFTDYYDEYVKTLRIIGFDTSGNLICNGFHNSLWEVTHEESINITQELNKFQGGTCHLYFIANEENYNTTKTQSLTDFLGNVNLDEESLQNCIINFSNNDEWGSDPILMTAQKSPYIQAGKTKQNIGKIELVRCVAKVQLQIIDETNTAKINGIPTLSGSYPDSYSLLDVGTYTAWNENESFPVELQEKEDDNTLYTSQEVYFPERLFAQNTEENALKFKFNLNDKHYEVAIADNTGTDFNIYRNTHYTVIATLKKKETVTFNVLVNAWDEKTMKVPAFE